MALTEIQRRVLTHRDMVVLLETSNLGFALSFYPWVVLVASVFFTFDLTKKKIDVKFSGRQNISIGYKGSFFESEVYQQ